jgi:hypothetical protein
MVLIEVEGKFSNNLRICLRLKAVPFIRQKLFDILQYEFKLTGMFYCAVLEINRCRYRYYKSIASLSKTTTVVIMVTVAVPVPPI